MHHTSYVEALSRRLATTHLSTLARMRVKEKQVLIDKDPTENSDPLQGLTEHKLVTKANEALAEMTLEWQAAPVNPEWSAQRSFKTEE